VESNVLFPDYSGWGSSYNEFPVLYAITAFAHWLTGIDVLVLMSRIIPIFGGLTIAIFYFIVYELSKNQKIALLSSLFLSVLPFHVYQLSHASPLTIGHFFMMLTILMFIKFRKNTIYIIPLLISTSLLIMSHHLTTYFFLISIIFIFLLENSIKKEWTKTFKKDLLYIIITSIIIFNYWAYVAKTVYNNFMRSGLNIFGFNFDAYLLIISFYLFLVGALIFIWIKRRYHLFREHKKPTFHINTWKFSIFIFTSTSILLIFLFVRIPWTNFTFTPFALLFSFPLLVITSLGVVGFSYTHYVKNGYFFRGWIFGLMISLIFAIATNNTIILPHRHLEYIMLPLAVFAAYGIGGLFHDHNHNLLLSWLFNKRDYYITYIYKKIKISYHRRQIHVVIIFALVLTLGASVYPSHRALNQSVEEITPEDLLALKWMDLNLNKNQTIVTSDHRLERMAEAYGFNTSKDETIEIWRWGEDKDYKYIPELLGIGYNYSRITHIILDDILVEVFHRKFRLPGFQITDDVYEKFQNRSFKLLQRFESDNIDVNSNKPIHWTEIYEVDWSYIEKHYFE
jgi:hypothetical protein